MQVCPSELSGCEGGTATGDGLCKTGFTGPLCAVCADGYFAEDNDCISCSGSQKLSSSAIALIVAGVVVTLLALGYLYRRYRQLRHYVKEDADGAANMVFGANSSDTNFLDKALIWLSLHIRTVIAKLKIVLVTYQIVAAVPEVFSVTLPKKVTSMLQSLAFVNLDFVSVLAVQCSSNYTFIDKLIIRTLLPIGVTALLFVAFLLHAVYVGLKLKQNPHRKYREGRDKFDSIKDKYLNYFFYLTYLVLPSVSTLIFQTFLCTNIDPNNEDCSDTDRYLTADMSISCTSDYYYGGRAYAVLMIFVYPVGIPAMYMYLLYKHHTEIKDRATAEQEQEMALLHNTTSVQGVDEGSATVYRSSETVSNTANPMLTPPGTNVAVDNTTSDVMGTDTEPTGDGGGNKNTLRSMSAPAARLSFLWAAFKPQYWYWEVVETSRRLMLTAILSVTGAGSSQQAVLALLLAIFYIKLYNYYSPYEERQSDITAEIGQYQILFTFLGALITMDSLLEKKYNSTVDWLLILLNLGVLIAFGSYEITDLYNELVESREEEERTETEKKNSNVDDGDKIEMVNVGVSENLV